MGDIIDSTPLCCQRCFFTFFKIHTRSDHGQQDIDLLMQKKYTYTRKRNSILQNKAGLRKLMCPISLWTVSFQSAIAGLKMPLNALLLI